VLGVLALLALALTAGVLSGIVGTGSSLLVLPVLVVLDGPRIAVPVMTIASVLGNLGRVVAWWRHIHWRPTAAYAVPGVPAAALGAHTLLTIPPPVVEVALAVFFAAMIPGRRLLARTWRPAWWHMALAGAAVGFLTGLALSTGPVSVPIFTGYGLTGGAFLGSEAAASLLLYAAKIVTFGTGGALSGTVVAHGLLIGLALLAGSVVARRIVERFPVHVYERVLDLVLAVAAVGILVGVRTGH
jgi:uncharacterized protein